MDRMICNHSQTIASLCRKYGVQRLEAFGSVVRGDFGLQSDVDLLANFARTTEPGYSDRYLDFAESLEALLGRKVDLLTPGAIRNPRFADTIKREAVSIYESTDDQAA